MRKRSLHLLLIAALLSLSACLKSNGEPYPGAAQDKASGSPDYDIDFPDNGTDTPIQCSSTLHDMSAHLESDDTSLNFKVFQSGSLLMNASAREDHFGNTRSYLTTNAKLYISRTSNAASYPAYLLYRDTTGWHTYDVFCTSTGYSED